MLVPGARQLVIFHSIIDGRCCVGRPDEEPVELAAGDAVMLAQGDPHLMADRAGQEPIPVVELLPMPPWEKTPFLVHGGTGALTRVLCGFLHCADAELSPFLASLPPVLRDRKSTRLNSSPSSATR